ncbi:hypothetical protein GDO78_018316 [Eleutherodactylus coqui]|uniref:Uncharacterized protein n=1 Tax=Eleutherodactylus coqui TaxID=57060 RepID=A0A8J6EJ33_ELECQ|nr:hypothetical protein GDO78_018316 [Eleutherodactylus coqui]
MHVKRLSIPRCPTFCTAISNRYRSSRAKIVVLPFAFYIHSHRRLSSDTSVQSSIMYPIAMHLLATVTQLGNIPQCTNNILSYK